MATIGNTTTMQRVKRNHVPYTVLHTKQVPLLDDSGELPVVRFVPAHHLVGYTADEQWVVGADGEGEWKYIWEEHDLGQQATPQIASEVAAEWRLSLAANGEG